ncbi:MAG: sulfatase-like hydrolase/transferase [Pirellulales bacterium]|nr:sulfatase-like hydrolase/transferase [Pirellulales bacterium]
MERREFITYAGLGACSSLAAATGQSNAQRQSGPSKRPNILFIMTDQQHAGMLSCAGNKDLKTPALDQLAATGIRFEKAYVPNPVCCPCRFSLQTGLMPSHIGASDNPSGDVAPISESVAANSLGPLFQKAGYDCAYGGKVHVPIGLWDKVKENCWDYLCKYGRDELVDACSDYFEQPRDKPFLLFASFVNPHDVCYMAYLKYSSDDLINGRFQIFNQTLKENNLGANSIKNEQDLDDFVANHCPKLPDNYDVPENEPEAITTKYLEARDFRMHVRQHWDEKMWRLHRWMYARLTERVDKNIGKILGALQQSEAADNTLIVFTSDHGDMDAAHRTEHKSIPYDEAVRVPFIMSYPGRIPAGTVNQQHFISNGLDLLPTLCDYGQIAAPSRLPGRSVRPLAEGRPADGWRETLVSESQNARMLCHGAYKYTIYDGGKNRECLIDQQNDPGEMKNIANDPRFAHQLNQMRKLLCDWVETVDDRIGRKYVILPGTAVRSA